VADFTVTADVELEDDEFAARLDKILAGALRGGGKAAERLTKEMKQTSQYAEVMAKSMAGLKNNSRNVFDTRSLAVGRRTLEDMLRVMDRMKSGSISIASGFKQIQSMARGGFLDLGHIQAVNKAYASQNAVIQQTIRTRGEMEQRATRLAEQQSRERIVAAQQEGAQTLAATRASSQQRIAIIRGMFAQIRALERGMGAVFRTMTSAAAAGFRGIGSAASGLSGIMSRTVSRFRTDTNQMSSVTDRLERSLVTDLRSTLSRRESALATSMSRQTRTMSSNISSQITQLDRLESRLSRGVLGAATGRSAAGATLGIGGLAAGVGGGIGLGALLTSGFTRYTDLERINSQLEAMLGSAEAAQALLAQIDTMARRTPLPLTDLSKLSVDFLSMGVAAEKVVPYTEAIADAIGFTGGSAEQMQRISLAMRQIASTGKLQGDEFNQLAENLAGLNINQMLADQLTGGDVQAFMAMRERGEVSAEMFTTAFITGLQSDPRIKGAAARISELMAGSFANTKTAFARLGASIIGLLREPIMLGLEGLRLVFSNLAKFISGEGLSPLFENLRVAVGGAVIALGGLTIAKVAAEALLLLRDALAGVFTPMGAIVATFALAGAAFALLLRHSEALRDALARVGTAILNAFGAIGDAVTSFFSGPLAAGAEGGVGLLESFGDTLAGWIDNLSGVIDRFANETVPRWTEAIRKFDIGGIFSGSSRGTRDFAAIFGKDLRTTGEKIGDQIRQIFRTIADAVKTGWEFVGDVISGSDSVDEAILSAAGIDSRNLGEKIGDQIRSVFRTIANAVVTGWNFVRDVATGSDRTDLGNLLGLGIDTRTGGEKIGDRIRQILGSVVDAVQGFWSRVRPLLQGIIDGFRSFFDNFGGGDLARIGGVIAATFAGFAAGGPVGAAVAGSASALALLWGTELGEGLRKSLAAVGKVALAGLKSLGSTIAGAFDGDFMSNVGKGLLNVIETIGFTLGRLVSHPAFLRSLALIAAAGVLVVARFGEGVIRGIGTHIDDIAEMIGDALISGLKAVFTGDVFGGAGIAAGIVAALVGANALRQYVGAGKKIATAVATGTKESLTVGGAGLGNNLTGFMQGMFGNNLATQVRNDLGRVRAAASTEMARITQVLRAAGKDVSFAGFGKALEGGLDKARGAMNNLISEFGRARVAGLQLRTGFQQIGQGLSGGLRNINFSQITQGFGQVMAGLKTGGRELAGNIGQTAAAAIGAAFSGQMLAEADSMGEAVISALGVVSSVAMGFATGGWVGGVVAGIAAIGGAILGMGSDADETKRQVSDLASELEGLSGGELRDALVKDVKEAFEDLDIGVRDAMGRLGLSYGEFVDQIRNKESIEDIVADMIDGMGPIMSRFADQLRSGVLTFDQFSRMLKDAGRNITFPDLSGSVGSELDRVGIHIDDFRGLIGGLADSTGVINTAFGEVAVNARLIGPSTESAAQGLEHVGTAADGSSGGVRRLTGELQAASDLDFTNMINGIVNTEAELQKMSDARFADNINNEIRRINDELETSKTRAEEAKEAILSLFDIDLAPTFQQAMDEVAIATENIASNLATLGIDTPQFRQEVRSSARGLVDAIEEGIRTDRITTVPQLEFERNALRGQIEAGLIAAGTPENVRVAFMAAVDAQLGSVDWGKVQELLPASFPNSEIFVPATISVKVGGVNSPGRAAMVKAIEDELAINGLNQTEIDFLAYLNAHAAGIEDPAAFIEEVKKLAAALGLEITIEDVPVTVVPGTVSLDKGTAGRARGNGPIMGFGGGGGGGGLFTAADLGLGEIKVTAPLKITPNPISFGLAGGGKTKGAGGVGGLQVSAAQLGLSLLTITVPLKVIPSPISFGAVGGGGKTKGGGFSISAAQLGLSLLTITVPLKIIPSPISFGAVGGGKTKGGGVGITAAQLGISVLNITVPLRITPSPISFDTAGVSAAGMMLGSLFAASVAANRGAAAAAGNSLKVAVMLGATVGANLGPAGANLARSYAVGVAALRGAAAGAGTSLKLAAIAGASGGSLAGQGSALGRSYAAGVASARGAAAAAGASLRNAAMAAARGGSLFGAGQTVGASFGAGIRAAAGAAASAAAAMVKNAINAAKSAASIASPSKVFIEMGEFMGEGLAIGIKNSTSMVVDAAAKLMDDSITAAEKAKGYFREAMPGEKDSKDFDINYVNGRRLARRPAMGSQFLAFEDGSKGWRSVKPEVPAMTPAQVRQVVEASGGTTEVNVSLVVEGDVYDADRFEQKVNGVLVGVGRRIRQGQRQGNW
jgi:tape measure domain-containing protein